MSLLTHYRYLDDGRLRQVSDPVRTIDLTYAEGDRLGRTRPARTTISAKPNTQGTASFSTTDTSLDYSETSDNLPVAVGVAVDGETHRALTPPGRAVVASGCTDDPEAQGELAGFQEEDVISFVCYDRHGRMTAAAGPKEERRRRPTHADRHDEVHFWDLPRNGRRRRSASRRSRPGVARPG